ncbi:hypothetical protein BDN71DRAFT_193689 [Pleurotus eryngii]|uniref:Uncharacterized protein n=1 Tax=Pleurotus eryngii TaxID=5323 RepID=A0A9P6D445_PLEER|nr:hypothetical protein BDN71DRAFT_193689 [Pleurotus eryngii]
MLAWVCFLRTTVHVRILFTVFPKLTICVVLSVIQTEVERDRFKPPITVTAGALICDFKNSELEWEIRRELRHNSNFVYTHP